MVKCRAGLSLVLFFVAFSTPALAGDVPDGASCEHLLAKKANPFEGVKSQLVAPLGTVDGAQYPEEIPDDVAFGLFMSSLRGRDEVGARLLLEAAQFEPQDADRLLNTARALRDRGQGENQQPASRLAWTEMLRDARFELSSTLGPKGAVALKAHLARVKGRTLKVPAPVGSAPVGNPGSSGATSTPRGQHGGVRIASTTPGSLTAYVCLPQ